MAVSTHPPEWRSLTDGFQDKYFNGIDLDLSKALFIFSYNDASLIDRILLDRIHRIKFEHLTIEDKLVITRKHLLPEIFKNMGVEGCIEITDENIEYIVEKYTNESGIRKFKELLFEKYKGKFDRWLKNVPCGIEDEIKEYILSQLN